MVDPNKKKSKNVRFRERLSTTGAKVRRVIALVYLEDLEKRGKTYWDLIGYLDHLHLKAVVSPIHDRDTFTADDVLDWCTRHIDPETGDLDTHYLDNAPYVGKPKKPHCHIGILMTSQKDAYQWSELMEGCVHIRPTMWDQMLDYAGFVRYCAHLDSPEKAKYSPFEVHSLGGADLSDLLKDDKMEKIATLTEVMHLSMTQDFKYFHQVADAAFKSQDIDQINCVVGRSSFFIGYYSSKRQKRLDDAEAKKKQEENKCSR